MFVTIKFAVLCLVSLVFGFTVVMTNAWTVYTIVLLSFGVWTLNNFLLLIVLTPATFLMDVVLWYILTELSSVFGFGQRPRRLATD